MNKLIHNFCSTFLVKPIAILLILFTFISAQSKLTSSRMLIDVSKATFKISKNIYGHFSEHLGSCIYGGIWVGEESKIPNVRGIRTDVVEAMKKIKVPILRWPGGCFADEYHWKDGLGPRSERPAMINTNWGGITEDNSFGTHEFLDLCQQIGCEPYFSGNLGSGTVQELSQWVEYVNSDNISPMTLLRKNNGREKSWGVKYWGLGNESWGCGGNMNPEYYSNVATQYSSFMKTYGLNTVNFIAVGAYDSYYEWTDVVMRNMANRIWGLSFHSYTWAQELQATDVTEENWYSVLSKTLLMEEYIKNHSEIMNKYDPGKSVALVIDEWGTWYSVEPGTNPGFLFQQNTLRDALVAGINLNIFNNHCDRVRMAAIAQAVNVLQSIILTKDDKMVLTPTYHVFDMYKVHQDAVLIPLELQTDSINFNGSKIPKLNASASLDKNSKIHITVCNLSTSEDILLACDLSAYSVNQIKGQILTSESLDAHNTFEIPNEVIIQEFSGFNYSSNHIEILVPKHSVIALEAAGDLEIKSPIIDSSNLKEGLVCNLYEGKFQRLPDYSYMTPVKTEVIDNIIFPQDVPSLNFGLTYSGYLKIETEGMYEFFLSSDDGSKLTINEDVVILNDGLHAVVEKSGTIFLTKGYHKIEVAFFQLGGGKNLKLEMKSPVEERREVPDKLFFHYAGSSNN